MTIPNALPSIVATLLADDAARFFLADAIAGAEADADEEASWDEILVAALSELAETPAGRAP